MLLVFACIDIQTLISSTLLVHFPNKVSVSNDNFLLEADYWFVVILKYEFYIAPVDWPIVAECHCYRYISISPLYILKTTALNSYIKISTHCFLLFDVEWVDVILSNFLFRFFTRILIGWECENAQLMFLVCRFSNSKISKATGSNSRHKFSVGILG